MGPVAILILAAGASSRMRGADKLLEVVEGLPVLRRQAKAALATGAPVFVALPLDRPARAAALEGVGVTPVAVPDAAEGMSASIRRGVAALPAEVTGVAILPGDMPELSPDDLRVVLEAFDDSGTITRGAGEDGTPGHPVVFPRMVFDELAVLTGDVGAKAVIADRPVVLVPLPARHALTDLDTPEEWAAWRADKP